MKKICENCKNWDQYKIKTWGGCAVISNLLDMCMEEGIYDPETDEICTPWDFGCNRWKEKRK